MDGSPETLESLSSRLVELRKHGSDGNFDRAEETWLQLVEDPQVIGSHLEAFLEVADRFLPDEKKRDRLGTLLELLLSTLPGDPPPRPLIRLYGLLVYCFPEKPEYRNSFSERYQQLYPVASAERAFFEASGFGSGRDPVTALKRLELLLRFREGAYVYHASGWGVGQVVGVDPFLKQVKVDLAHKKQHRIAIDVIDSILEPLADDSFHVLKHRGGETLRQLRDDDPVRLVGIVLDALGSPIALKDIKHHLVPDVVPQDIWARWWNRTKGLLRDTGLFRVGDRTPHLVERLAKAVSYEDELVARFLRSNWTEARQIARQASRKAGAEFASAWEKIREYLLRVCREEDPVRSIEAALIVDRGESEADSGVLKEVFSRLTPGDLAAALEALQVVDDQRRAAESLPMARPADWEQIAARLYLGRKDGLRDVCRKVLASHAPHKIFAVIQDLVRSPKSAPDAFCAALQDYLAEPNCTEFEPFREKSPRDLLVLLLDLLEHIQHRSSRQSRNALKATMGKVHDLLAGKKCEFFLDGLATMSSEERHDVHDRLVRNEDLPVHTRGIILDAITMLEPALQLRGQVQTWDEKAIYVTAAGLHRRREELREIMEVKLPKVFEDVGRAAAFGDLSENAEYTAALEERDKLTKRAEKMRTELDQAKIIDPGILKEGIVGLGSRVRLRNSHTGDEVTYSILGPWDGVPQEGILSYTSPLGRLFLGKKVGEVLEAQLPGGTETYEILETTKHSDGGK